MNYILKDASVENNYHFLDSMLDAIADTAMACAENGEEEFKVEIVYKKDAADTKTFEQGGKTYALSEDDIFNIAAYANRLVMRADATDALLKFFSLDEFSESGKTRVANEFGVSVDMIMSDDALLAIVDEYKSRAGADDDMPKAEKESRWQTAVEAYIEKFLDSTLMVKDSTGEEGYAVILQKDGSYVARIIGSSFDGDNDVGMTAAEFYKNYTITGVEG